MKFLLVFTFASLVTGTCLAQSILFQQNFDAGGVVGDYVNASNPGATKFNAVSGPSAAIIGGTLQFNRVTNGTTGGFSHSTDFSPASNSLYIQFDFETVSTTALAGSSALIFYVGSGFTSTPTSPDVADQYARFGIGFTNTGGQFTVRHIGAGGVGSANSSPFTGKQTLTFILNNTGFTVTYLQPGGGLQTLANDTYDLWVGTTEVFNGRAVLTPAQNTTDFKLRIDDDVYAAAFQFDNFLIRDINGALPVSVLDFKAVAAGSQVGLSWQSATETPTVFTVERSTNPLDFSPITQPQTAAISNGQPRPGGAGYTYRVTDNAPTPGLNYYRLRQTGTDGQAVFSKIVTVDMPDNVPDFTILNNPGEGLTINLQPNNLPNATYLLTTPTGQSVSCQSRKTPEGRVTLLLQHPLPSGVYLLTAQTETASITRRLLVR